MTNKHIKLIMMLAKMKRFFLINQLQLFILLSILACGCKGDENGVPTLSTIVVTNITHTSAKSGGNIKSDGGSEIIERGVCWCTSQYPSILDDKTTDGISAGSFSSSIVGLFANTTYYVRAYATNSSGTGYGNVVSFTTQATNFTDPRDGNVYQIVTIGDQVWMAENLRYLPKVAGPDTGSSITPYFYVYEYYGTNVDEAINTSNYSTFGVLYNWPAAVYSCPEGWHLPSEAEWDKLFNFLARNSYNYDGTVGGDREKIAKSMASASGWCSSSYIGAVGNIDYPSYINKSGFTALQGNLLNSDHFSNSCSGYWWGATVSDTPQYSLYIKIESNSSSVYKGFMSNNFGFSVRCVKN